MDIKENLHIKAPEIHIAQVKGGSHISQKQHKRKNKKRPIWLSITKWIGIVFTGFVGVVFAACLFLIYGPFVSARDLLVSTAMETSAAKYICYALMPRDMIDQILISNTVDDITDKVDVNQIQVPTDVTANINDFKVEDVHGPTFQGKMMIIRDPSRVSVGCAPNLGANGIGQKTVDIIKSNGGFAGVNGGGFSDPGGMGNGGQPLGFVIKDGKVLFGGMDSPRELIGFDKNNRLVLGTMTGKQATDLGVRDALSFGPLFIINGEPAKVSGTGGGLNPRTVIGQKKDGTILLLVLDGRSVNSLGASYADCISVMQRYGAYNAANLDGGSSSMMILNNEIINNCASLYGPRETPTAIVVKEAKK